MRVMELENQHIPANILNLNGIINAFDANVEGETKKR